MSASYVRQTFRTWAQNISAPVGVQYYDTVNTEQDPQDDTWWSSAFYAESMSGETFCGPGYMEAGVIEVIVFARPGIGDIQAVTDLEAIVREIYNQVDPTQRLVLGQFDPVVEDSGGGADARYRVAAYIAYSLSL